MNRYSSSIESNDTVFILPLKTYGEVNYLLYPRPFINVRYFDKNHTTLRYQTYALSELRKVDQNVMRCGKCGTRWYALLDVALDENNLACCACMRDFKTWNAYHK